MTTTYGCDDDRTTSTLRDEAVDCTAGPIFFHHTVHNTMGSPLRPMQSKTTKTMYPYTTTAARSFLRDHGSTGRKKPYGIIMFCVRGHNASRSQGRRATDRRRGSGDPGPRRETSVVRHVGSRVNENDSDFPQTSTRSVSSGT